LSIQFCVGDGVVNKSNKWNVMTWWGGGVVKGRGGGVVTLWRGGTPEG